MVIRLLKARKGGVKMRTNKVVGLMLLAATLFGLAMVMGGCGATIHESSAYYYPNWLPDGRIVCWKVTSRWSEAIWGRKEEGTTAYITAMDPDGKNEVDIFEDSSWGGEITCSPTGEMIGYIAYPDKLTIVNLNGTNKRVVPNVAGGAKYFDWSPDGTKIAYAAYNQLYVINADGTGNTSIASGAYSVTWRSGNKIVYVYINGTDYLKIAAINPDGSSNEVFSIIGNEPQIKNGINEIVYSGLEKKVKKINMDGANDQLLFSNYERSTLKLSFDNTKIVGGDLITGGGSDIGGIWVTDINSGISTKIR